jgi:hypothetical protein
MMNIFATSVAFKYLDIVFRRVLSFKAHILVELLN